MGPHRLVLPDGSSREARRRKLQTSGKRSSTSRLRIPEYRLTAIVNTKGFHNREKVMLAASAEVGAAPNGVREPPACLALPCSLRKARMLFLNGTEGLPERSRRFAQLKILKVL